MALKEYNKKRNFNNTNEPKGKLSKVDNKHLKFVIQYHQARTKHFDFRIEHNGVLLSWAVPKGLSLNPKDKRLAVQVEDHPLDYIDFEGIIPKGNYGAGSVEIFDKGYYEPLQNINTGLKKGHIKILLIGEKFKGCWDLIKTDDRNWLLIKSEDKFVEKVKKNKKIIKNPFTSVDVKLAKLSNSIPKGKNWIFEIKYDGYRIVAFCQNKKVKLLTRNNKDFTKKFESIANSIKQISQDAFVLDGEIVSFDNNGRSDFSLLQENLKYKKGTFYYVVFGILSLNGEDLRKKSLKERKEILEKILVKQPQNIIYSNFVLNKGKESFKLAKKLNLEGVVAKDIESKYSGNRNGDWLKIKCYLRQEFVIGGYTVTDKNKNLSSILVGYYNRKKLIYVGKVGTGFTDEQKILLSKKFKKLKSDNSYFKEEINEKDKIFYLKPELIAEIQYVELTKDKLLRQPSFIGLREDKEAQSIRLELSDAK